MTKSELIAELATGNPHLRGADIELIVATIFDQITDALARGDRVELRGFGAFTVKQRGARIGHNPRTGVTVQVRDKTVPYFKTGKELRDQRRGVPGTVKIGGDSQRLWLGRLPIGPVCCVVSTDGTFPTGTWATTPGIWVNRVATGSSPSPAYATPLARPIAATAAMIIVLMVFLLSPASA